MLQKSIFTILCYCLCSISSFLTAQSLLHHIPYETSMVLTFHPTVTQGKVDIQALKQLEVCQMMMKDIAREINPEAIAVITDALQNPQSYGINLKADSYFVINNTPDGAAYTFLFELSDAKVFAEFFKTSLLNAEKGLHLKSEDGLTTATSNGSALIWNDHFAALTTVDVKRHYDFNDSEWAYEYEDEWIDSTYVESDTLLEEEMVEIFEEESSEDVIEENMEETVEEEAVEGWEEEDNNGEYDDSDYNWGGETDEEYAQRQSEAITQFIDLLVHLSPDSTILSNSQFAKSQSHKSDAHLWMDYSGLINNSMGVELLLDPSMGAFMMAYQNLIKDTYLSMDLNFNPGAIDLDYRMFVNEPWLKYLRAAQDAKINRKFQKYIKGDNLLGYMSFNYNMKNVLKEGKNLLLPAFESIPYMGAMAPDVVDILDIFLDEEAVYNFFKGDFCFAVTGLRQVERMVRTYDYDEEFNLTEVEELKKETLPEFVMMLSYGNEDHLKRFFRLGEKAGGLQKMGNYYQVMGTADTGMDFYLTFHQGILFFTNDSDLIKNRLSSGYKSKERISRRHRKMMKENAYVLFWDIPKSLNSASVLGLPFGDTGTEMVNVSKQSLESILVTSPQTLGASVHSEMSFRFANKQMNSLEQLLQFANEIYKMEKGGKSM